MVPKIFKCPGSIKKPCEITSHRASPVAVFGPAASGDVSDRLFFPLSELDSSQAVYNLKKHENNSTIFSSFIARDFA
jgi:hypothetical protein